MQNRPIPKAGERYLDYLGEHFEVIAIANERKDSINYPIVVYHDAELFVWYTPLAEFLEELGDKPEGTCYYRFQKISGVIPSVLEGDR